MRTTGLKAMLALGAVYLVGGVLQAQDHAMNARVPFDFAVGQKVLPAGDYTIVNSPLKATAEVLNRHTGAHYFVLTGGSIISNFSRSSLLFHRYGAEYFLAEIRSGEGGGRQVTTSKREREIMNSRREDENVVLSMAKRGD